MFSHFLSCELYPKQKLGAEKKSLKTNMEREVVGQF